MLYIVGIGPGSKEYILPKATEILEASELILGFSRAIESINYIKTKIVTVSSLQEIISITNLNKHKKIAVIASGDPGFYGISNYIKSKYDGDIQVIPGISSFQYLMAKLNKSWQNSHLGSLHGREESFLEEVKKNKLSIWLTDKSNSPDSLCRRLYKENIAAMVYVGENLSYEDEVISSGNPEELMNRAFDELSVVVIENDLY
ncbi:precorrin-6y C5,15-methyltransferase (decarboxylating) subunit CbiE [Clostridium folliculivorans]|uniref:Precorrin-6y C5,15-methyltransferase (Decarboxylating) subunit CbiE n=1 Tax=Clostridium folliculivorans TaxID=2886038 RepID=A0A9W5Y4A5_9CLOT|nr:precorrin-6y C5,15-methyltransferase (decarboxylating) subunit CbiE [Clostridium folliculivorans]GKU26302.1 precorrin-6y C5,15-methyltransferase (decarboxylating) subunit CbiE [Clostridium folliculivorans]GKU31974.1 precorrin-6y C5,15-methyltransferase (decarboxylating) subunit CbiE [Clostridium folliculivorans]